MKVTILAVGRLRPPYVDDVARRIPERAFVVLLDERGRQMTSEGLAAFLDERRLAARPLCFVIGGAYGIELAAPDLTLSLGLMTLPHQLARVVLVEQLYRAHKILAGEPYHH